MPIPFANMAETDHKEEEEENPLSVSANEQAKE